MILGITGRVGSGKTSVEMIIKGLFPHCWIADLDVLGHQTLEDQNIKSEISSRFGDSVLDSQNNINRKALGDIVFSNHEELLKLNAIIHPEIKQKVINLHEEKSKSENGLIVGALIEEIGLSSVCDKVLVVDADDNEIIDRIGGKFNKISRHQRSRELYVKSADILIKNTFDQSLSRLLIECFEKYGIKL